MANPLFNQLGGNNFAGLQQQFDQFKRTVSGDPKAMVENLINSGQMSQQQFQQLSSMAQMLQGKIR